MSQSDTESMSVRDRDCLCPRSETKSASVPDAVQEEDVCSGYTKQVPPFDIKRSALDRIFHARFNGNRFKP